jgi:putative nucleotidyltransferase with HDIG domain
MKIPEFVMTILNRLRAGGYEAYVVGGAVRDFCMGRPLTDWDIATPAAPGEITSLFQDMKTFSLKHETVTLVSGEGNVEVSAFRTERLGGGGLEGDLAHRDFAMNAMAYDPARDRMVDPFGGREDIARKRIRAVGVPEDRFREDPLRLMRAVRFAIELGFRIDPDTRRSAESMAGLLGSAANERVRDELVKLLVCPKPSGGILLMKRMGLLAIVIPELLEGVGLRQNPQYHRFTVFRHNMETLDRVEPDPVLRLTALLHDIAKPRVREKIAGKFRFYGHDKASAGLAREIMERLRFGNEMIDRVTHLIAHHMRDLDYSREWSDGAVRRFIRNLGEENVPFFLSFREADILAHGIMDKKLSVFWELKERIRRLLASPFPKKKPELAIDGHKVMEVLGLNPGPLIGRILDILMEKVTDDPGLNTEESLVSLLRSMEPKAEGNGASRESKRKEWGLTHR